MKKYTITDLGNGMRRVNKHASIEQAKKHGGVIVKSTHKDVRRCQEFFRSQPYCGTYSHKIIWD